MIVVELFWATGCFFVILFRMHRFLLLKKGVGMRINWRLAFHCDSM
jgi:hypothetical protein